MFASDHVVSVKSAGGRGWDPYVVPDTPESLHALFATTRFGRSQRIDGPGDRGESWCKIISGAARQCAQRTNGCRQILDFLLPGDYFAATQNRHNLLIEALSEGTTVASYSRRTIEQLIVSDPRVRRQIRDITLAASLRLQRQILTLGRTTAVGKVSFFLVYMAERLSDGRSDTILLPMSRYDIADYLALSVESVSRCLTCLKRRGAIALVGRRGVRIRDRSVLAEDADES